MGASRTMICLNVGSEANTAEVSISVASTVAVTWVVYR
jgi:hypothetical protein